MSKWLIIIGSVLLAIGLLWHFFPWALNWFGKLPGDIHKQLDNGDIYFPITSMIIVSVLITILLNIFRH